MQQRKPFTPPVGVQRPPPIRDGMLPDDPKIDWKGYFISFCQVHKEPELIGGRLVFRDGWTYPSTDYRGPESPPPSDNSELDALVLAYWKSRLDRCSQALEQGLALKGRIESEARKRTLPLMQTVITKDDEGNRKRGCVPLNTAALDNKIRWLRADIKEAQEALVSIDQYYKDKKESQ